ncbi:Sec-independent protein translocase protein TatB [Ancylobacter sp. FA202]|uniref:Sec-independent protein translocase protein TatB n=1 Tax=Ancylobacter sp. FA202 TaxID=1111106 RepID=UPI0003682587|nr:Sec-independent protein translocase protein TatB [Ancylobacter sp. FA202]
MFDIGWTEFLVIGVVALVVIGPKELPRVLRTMGQGVRKLRHMAGEFQGQFNEALREAELSDLKDSVSGLRSDLSGLASNARESISKALPTNPLQDIETDLKAPTGSVEAGTGLPPAAVAEPALPAPGDLEPHPFETVEDEVRNAAAGLEASAPAAASAPVAAATPSPSAPDSTTAPRPQTAAAPAEAPKSIDAPKPVDTPKPAETTKSADMPKPAEPAPAVTPAAKPKRARAAAVADAASTDTPSAEAPKPAPRRTARKPVAATEVAEPELFEAVASLDQGAPAERAAKPAAKRATKPRVKVKPASGNEGPAL